MTSYRWSGGYYEGAMRVRREEKRAKAEAMAAVPTPHERTKAHRLNRCFCADFPGRKPGQRKRRRAVRAAEAA